MVRPSIYAKSALEDSNIKSKVDIGCDGIEIQLLAELVDGKLGCYHYAKDVYDMSLVEKYNITAVHCPLLSHYGLSDVNIESLCDSNDFMLLDQVCYIANEAGKYHNRKTIVVVHSETFRGSMMLLGDTWKRVLNCVGCLLCKYQYIEFAIENITPIREVEKGGFHLSNNFYNDNIEIVEELRNQLNTDRVGTVLDTCHAEISNKVYKALRNIMPDVIPVMNLSMDKYFEMNKDLVKLFHFSHTVGSGYGEGRHGQPFTEDSKDVLMNYLRLYGKYDIKAPISLEVAEIDYLKSDGYASSYKTILECFEGLGI